MPGNLARPAPRASLDFFEKTLSTISVKRAQRTPTMLFMQALVSRIAKTCPADQRSNAGSGRQLDCVCKNGTFATLSPDRLYWECTPCTAGTYQEAINASSCDVCAPGTESTVVEAYDAVVCTQCIRK